VTDRQTDLQTSSSVSETMQKEKKTLLDIRLIESRIVVHSLSHSAVVSNLEYSLEDHFSCFS